MRNILNSIGALGTLAALSGLKFPYMRQPGQLKAKRSPAEHERRIAAAEEKRARKVKTHLVEVPFVPSTAKKTEPNPKSITSLQLGSGLTRHMIRTKYGIAKGGSNAA